MIKRIVTRLTLSLSLLLSSSQASAIQSISFDSTTAIRIIGTAIAIVGVASLAHRKGSTLGGLVLLAAGTSAALGAERIVEEVNRHVTKSGLFDKISREWNHFCHKVDEELK